jgi:riboflavin kinase/FMN adenylyltransferase
MSTFRHSLNAPGPECCRGGVVTIGNFDGVHRGHQALVIQAQGATHELSGGKGTPLTSCAAPCVAVTFDPHPLQLLRPDAFQPLLTTVEYRSELLHAAGADHVLILETTAALLQLSPADFFRALIRDGLNAKALVEGFNFAFGRDRAGTPEVLRSLCDDEGIPLTLVPPQEVAGKPVSSSRVRAEILAGRLDVVQALLGRPHRLTGTVVVGQRRGQLLGFPTANLDHVRTLIPGDGVYTVRAMVGTQSWPAAANVGPNPTFGEQARKIEVHLIGFTGDLYGHELTVEFVEKIRDTRPFTSIDELVIQVRADIAQAAAILRLGEPGA